MGCFLSIVVFATTHPCAAQPAAGRFVTYGPPSPPATTPAFAAFLGCTPPSIWNWEYEPDITTPAPFSVPGIALQLNYDPNAASVTGNPTPGQKLGTSYWGISTAGSQTMLTNIGTAYNQAGRRDVVLNAGEARDLIFTNLTSAGTNDLSYGAIRFGTTPAGLTVTSCTAKDIERVTILNNGYVGIGTNSPRDMLHIHRATLQVSNAEANGTQLLTMGQFCVAPAAQTYSNIARKGDVVLRMFNYDSSATSNDHDIIVAARTNLGGIRFTTLNPDVERLTIFHDGHVVVKGSGAMANLGYTFGVNGGNAVIRSEAFKPALLTLKPYASDGTMWNMATVNNGSNLVITTGDKLSANDGSNWEDGIFMINAGGQVGIGTTSPGTDTKLAVNGRIACRLDLLVLDASSNFPDYVFENDYKLMPLSKLEQTVRKNKHLPKVPSFAEVQKNGIPVVALQKIMLEKIEELTLYIIEQDKRIKTLEEDSRRSREQSQGGINQ